MKPTVSTRLAAYGAAFALGTGALVSVGTPAAQAAQARAGSVKSTYSCSTNFGAQQLQVTTRVKLPKRVVKGKKVGARPVSMTVVLPQGLSDGLRLLGISSLSGQATGVKAKVGAKRVAIKGVSFTNARVPATGPMKFTAKGKTAPFKLRKVGKAKVRIPVSFKFTAKDQTGGTLTDQAPCTLVKGSASSLGTIKVIRRK